ncbi:MAG: hydrogenase formation protein HypD [Phycisphaerales bacterium]
MNHRRIDLAQALEQLRQAAAALPHDTVFMEVCGTHTMSAFRCGLHSLMPHNVTLLSGPGCPVCVTAQGDIDLLIELAADRPVTLCTYGDMMRVPGHHGSLEKVRGQGADVRIVYSATDAVQFATDHPDKQIVFAAIGFETTAPATAAAVQSAADRDLKNFSVLSLHKRVMPALTALLASSPSPSQGEGRGEGETSSTSTVHPNKRGREAQRSAPHPNPLPERERGRWIHGLMLPGHVAVITGWQHFAPLVDRFKIPCVVSGFEPVHMAASLATLAEMALEQRADLVNLYPEAVTAEGNLVAQRLIDHVFQPCIARWRGLCDIPDSGLELRPAFQSFDAMRRYALVRPADDENPACICGKIITGAAQPTDCKLFANGCTPVHPLGPCMVSSEGTCAAWFKHRRSNAGL